MNYQIEFNTGVIKPVECYKEAWAALKPHFWLFFAISIVGIMISGATFYILAGAMLCGIMFCFLDLIDGNEPQFEKLFNGFSFWKPGLLVFAVMIVPAIAVMALTYFPIIFATLMGNRLSNEELWSFLAGVFFVEAVFMLIMVCLHTLLLFAFPLIVDKNLTGWGSMKLSARAVWANLQGVAGLWAVGFIVSLAGLLLFCIGLYLSIPVIIAAHMVAYRKIFPGMLPSSGSGV